MITALACCGICLGGRGLICLGECEFQRQERLNKVLLMLLAIIITRSSYMESKAVLGGRGLKTLTDP